MQIRPLRPQDPDSGAYDDKRQQRADADQLAQDADGNQRAGKATRMPPTSGGFHGVRNRGCTAPAHRGSKPSRDME